MGKLQGICFVYDINSTYLNCYFKEFFKWIGVSYAGCFYRIDFDVFAGFRKYQFDEVVDVGGVLDQTERDRVSELSKQRMVRTISGDLGQPPVELLRNLLAELGNDSFEKQKDPLMDRLLTIYDQFDMVNLLYDYTLLLSQRLGEGNCRNIYDILNGVLTEVNQAVLKYYMIKDRDPVKLAYAMYAKCHCEKMIDELLYAQNKALKFDVVAYIRDVNKIYEFDPEYFKAEYLKADVVKLDSLYRPLGKTFLNFCVKSCPVDVCKSFYYYGLAKWLETDNQPIEAEKMFQMAYKKNPTNVKAIFKLAVYKLNKSEIELAKILLKRIAERWDIEGQKKQIPPRDLEYAYKANRLLAEIDKLSFHYAETAEQILKFIRSVKDTESGVSGNIMETLYPNETFRKDICEAMLQRLDAKCLLAYRLKI